jgi:hypothetical protein
MPIKGLPKSGNSRFPSRFVIPTSLNDYVEPAPAVRFMVYEWRLLSKSNVA